MAKRLPNLRKNNAWKLLRLLGFKKRKGVRWDYVKYLNDNLRIHIKWQKGGFYWHIDNH